jgi:hypothetical protein
MPRLALHAVWNVPLLLAVSAVSLAAPVARAGGVTEAETLFREARKLAEAGDWASACPKFAESERLDPAPGTLLNLADCEEHFGALVKAREHFGLAASGFRQGEKGRAVAMERSAALDKRIAHLTLRLAPSVPPTVTVRNAGVIVDPAMLGQSIDSDPGGREIVVSLAGRVDRKYTVTLEEGAHKEQILELGDPVQATVPPTVGVVPVPPTGVAPVGPGGETPAGQTGAVETPPQASSPKNTALVITFLAAGGASLIAGGVTGVITMNDASTVRSNCILNTRTCSTQQGVDAGAQGQTMSIVSTITLIAGAALAGVGGYFLLFPPKGGASSTSAMLVPFVSPESAGVILRRSF